MRPARRDLAIYRRDDYAHVLTFVDEEGVALVLAGTFTAQIRASEVDPTILATFTVDASDAGTGIIVLQLSKAATALLPGRAAWDLQHSVGGVDTTYLAGTVIADGDVTRANP